MKRIIREKYAKQIQENLQQLLFDLESDQIFALKVACKVYEKIAIFLNPFVVYKSFQNGDWLTLFHLFLFNIFIFSTLAILLVLPSLTRYSLLRNWNVFKGELISYFLNRRQSPPSHQLLLDALAVLTTILVTALYRNLNQLFAKRPSHLNLRRKAPFLLFQQANLLLAP